MNWRLKRLLSHLLVATPAHESIYDWIQKHLTRKWGRNVAHTLEGDTPFRMHMDFWCENFSDLALVRYFEFGVGRDLFSNLLAYCLGVQGQLAVDLNPYARRDLVNDNIRQFQAVRYPRLVRTPRNMIGRDLKHDLARFYGIDYRAPCDLLTLSAGEGPFQIISSTSVLEHVREHQVPPVIAQCARLCQPGGLISLEIDYSDHYSHGDRSITPYHFLQFSDACWEKLYMPHYYTNRLRHSDYRRLLLQNGFDIIREHTVVPAEAQTMLKSVPLSARFRDYPTEVLLITRGVFFAKKRNRPSGGAMV